MTVNIGFCTSAKVDLLWGRHHFQLSGGDTFKVGLIKVGEARTYDASSTSFANVTQATSDEASVSGGTGYTTGGYTLTRVDPTSSGTTAFTDFDNAQWTISGAGTLTASGCMIYNDTVTTPVADPSISVHPFSGPPSASGNGSTFTIQFPTPDASNAILRLA